MAHAVECTRPTIPPVCDHAGRVHKTVRDELDDVQCGYAHAACHFAQLGNGPESRALWRALQGRGCQRPRDAPPHLHGGGVQPVRDVHGVVHAEGHRMRQVQPRVALLKNDGYVLLVDVVHGHRSGVEPPAAGGPKCLGVEATAREVVKHEGRAQVCFTIRLTVCSHTVHHQRRVAGQHHELELRDHSALAGAPVEVRGEQTQRWLHDVKHVVPAARGQDSRLLEGERHEQDVALRCILGLHGGREIRGGWGCGQSHGRGSH